MAVLPLPGGEIVLGSMGNVPGRAKFLFVDPREGKLTSFYQYLSVSRIGDYLVARRPVLGKNQPAAVLIDPQTGKEWFGKEEQFRDFIAKGKDLYGVLITPDRSGRKEEKVPPPPY